MKINVIKIDKTEYIELKTKAQLYDDLKTRRIAGGHKAASRLTKEQRIARARNAAKARWSK